MNKSKLCIKRGEVSNLARRKRQIKSRSKGRKSQPVYHSIGRDKMGGMEDNPYYMEDTEGEK